MNILICGEGVTELGDWLPSRAHRPEGARKGLIEALLRQAGLTGWEVRAALYWSKARKFRAGQFRSPDHRALLGLLQDAVENECEAVVFVRDRDGDVERERAIERAVTEGPSIVPEVALAGCVAVEEIEAWLLACKGQRGSESHAHPKEVFAGQFHDERHLDGKVAVVEAADLNALPPDAHSLHLWLSRARAVLGTTAAA